MKEEYIKQMKMLIQASFIASKCIEHENENGGGINNEDDITNHEMFRICTSAEYYADEWELYNTGKKT